MDQSFLNVMVNRIETQSLSQSYDIANLGFIESAIARTVLASLLRSEDVVKSGLKWIAFDPSVLTESVWYMAFDPKEIQLREWEPETSYPPSALIETIRQCDGGGSPVRLLRSSLPAEGLAWEELAGVDQLYIFVSGDRKRLGDICGQIILAVPGMLFGHSKVTRAVQAVNQQIRDRARLLSAANPATLRLLNQLDHRYQEKIVRAIEGRELNRLLDQQFSSTTTAPSKRVARGDMSDAVGYVPPQKQLSAEERFKANVKRVKGKFLKAVIDKANAGGDAVDKDDQGVHAEKQLSVGYGTFHGWAKYKSGGRAFLLVMSKMVAFYEVLVGFVEQGVYKRDNITLFIWCDNINVDEIDLVSKPWKKLFENAGTEFDIQFLKDT